MLKEFYGKYGKRLYLVLGFLWIPAAFLAALLYSTRSFSVSFNLSFIQNAFRNEAGETEVFFLRFALFLFAGELGLVLLSPLRDAFLNFCFRFRYLIGLGVVVLAVLLNINGSSLALWNAQSGNELPWNVILGHPKLIRSDEWATFTPMIASQAFNHYRQMSPLFGSETNTFIVYGLPSFNFFGILFRPFLNGFLLFGFERGLAFFWSARMVCLFLAWFELVLKLAGGRKGLALSGAFIVSFSPIVQWWFAVNGLVEMLIFGPVALLSLDVMMRTEKQAYRLLSAFLLYVSGCGFVMTFYPASAVPLFLLYLILALYFVSVRVKDGSLKDRVRRRSFILVLAGTVALIFLTLGLILYQNLDTVKAVMNTDYPGKRVSTGGGEAYKLFSFWISPYFPWRVFPNYLGNECESATMADLFPFGFFFAVYVMIKNRKADVLNLVLMGFSLFVTAYVAFGFPEILAKLSLLSFSTTGRAIIVSELANVIVLLRSAEAYREKAKLLPAVIAAALYAGLAAFFAFSRYTAYFGKKPLLLVLVISFGAVLSILLNRRFRRLSCAFLAAASILSGAFVNPLQLGSANIQKGALYEGIEAVKEEDPDALWAVEGEDYPFTNYLLFTGVKAFNATQVYPRKEVFSKFDPEGTERSSYNRYAHIAVTLREEEGASFELRGFDIFTLHLSPEELADTAGVRYLVSRNDLSNFNSENVRFEQLFEAGGRRIYRVLK